MLSFSSFHDSFFAILDKNKHTDVVHFMGDKVTSTECSELNEVHSMFHFIAVLSTVTHYKLQSLKRDTIPHSIIPYTPPLEQTSYKPPIA